MPTTCDLQNCFCSIWSLLKLFYAIFFWWKFTRRKKQIEVILYLAVGASLGEPNTVDSLWKLLYVCCPYVVDKTLRFNVKLICVSFSLKKVTFLLLFPKHTKTSWGEPWDLSGSFACGSSYPISILYVQKAMPFLCMCINCQFDKGPLGPKLSWDYTSEMSKCDTGKYSFLHYITAIL